MRKVLFVLIPIIIALIVFFILILIVNRQPDKGALQVTSAPVSEVYLDGKLIGKTPLCKCDLPNFIKTGDYTVRLIPLQGDSSPFEQKITISPKIITVVDRTFGQGVLGEGSVLTFSPISNKDDAQISIVSFPDKAEVFLDNSISGISPLVLKKVTASDHEIKLTKDGYKDKIIKISTKQGFELEATIFMSVSSAVSNIATPSATVSAPIKTQITILSTPTGFLRVRQDPSIGAAQIGQVNPGDKFDLLDEKNGWYQIQLPNGTKGWVSSQYSQKSS